MKALLQSFKTRFAGMCLLNGCVLGFMLAGGWASAVEVEEGRQLLLTGQYDAAATVALKAIDDYGAKEEWQMLLVRSLLSRGKYPEARAVVTNALTRNSWSVQLRWLAREVFLANGDKTRAQAMLDDVVNSVSAQPRSYREPPDLVVFGQAALAKGADPKRVLDMIFEAARKGDPKLREVYLAAGQLGLDKHDYALAAKKFQEGLKQLPEDPDLHFGVAQAYMPSDGDVAKAALESTLKRNSNHVGALLLVADRSIDAEEYSEAEKVLGQIEQINPWHPDAWAYRAVLAHFRNDSRAETEARQNALRFWDTNPRVDFLIGQKLSQHYRFAEGAVYQKRALEYDPGYSPSKAQLAQDLLRLGQESEGWDLAEAVHKEDGYDIEAFNLTTLKSTLDKFATLTNQHFTVRMGRQEAVLYGSRVLELLTRARETLAKKYGYEPAVPTLVEIFPEQKDFAVRTFGIPGNPGYLGVCFGNVITANSPASQSSQRVNWQAVLWHEFAHVMTLGVTRNKMPRWLSEGISVYEELQANPAWGQRMGPRYREMILDGELTPVSKLSGAFLSPETDLHLQFAYFESSMVVGFIVEKFGMQKLRAILRDLGDGTEINEALAKHTLPIEGLDKAFAGFAEARARALAPGLDWERPPGEQTPAGPGKRNRQQRVKVTDVLQQASGEAPDWEKWASSRPTNFWVMTRQVEEALQAKQWEKAVNVLTNLVRLYPDYTGEDSPYRYLAKIHRELGQTNSELQVLTAFAARDDAAVDAYGRLMELGKIGGDWPMVHTNAQRYLAVNPLVPVPYRFLADASEKLDDVQGAISARRALIELDPIDPAEAHFRLAQLLDKAGNKTEARLHTLKALEEAPRYRDALLLLRKLAGSGSTSTPASTATEAVSAATKGSS